MTPLSVPAFAKINLYLEVLGRGANGFHRLETIFQSIGIKDDIIITCGMGVGISMRCNVADIPADQRNLAWRAAELFVGERVAEVGGISIDLHKGIPHGAGLGGGSSDAAAVLRGLQQLLPDWRTAAELHRIAATLGSDVPFFLHGGTALGLERGDIITPLPDLQALPVTILMPHVHVATPAVFQALTEDERGPRSEKGVGWWQQRLASGHWDASLLSNRLTNSAMRLCPQVHELLDWCQKFDYPFLMSGSGAACFALGHISAPANTRHWHTTFMPRSAQHTA